ncbi:unnamed protein product, partial [Medioppia subpectinata]
MFLISNLHQPIHQPIPPPIPPPIAPFIPPHIPATIPPNRLEELDLNDLSVELKDVKFTYDKSKGLLLNNINMSFPRSAIYGLLGPSGCGKTTLIKLIVGRLSPSSGTVRLNGRPQSDPNNRIPGVGVGYMPQEICLNGDFTIYETLNYFSKIYGLPEDYKKQRIDFVIKFLDLPDRNRLVGVLSGDQKIMASLAVAIIHKPPLLILDEPTVGVDPVLRERIWEHLLNLSKEEKTSIMITTHYIEECRRAHAIALMRNSKILVENSPHILLTDIGTDNLEDVYLLVCMADGQTQVGVALPPTITSMRSNASNGQHLQTLISGQTNTVSHSTKTVQRFGALIEKNFINLYRQKMQFLIQIVMPMIGIALFCACIGVLGGLQDNSPVAKKLSKIFLNRINTKTILFLITCYLLAIGLTALSTITERREGLLERSLVAGVHMYEILMSHVFVQIIILVFQTSFVMITVFMFFKIDCKGSYLLTSFVMITVFMFFKIDCKGSYLLVFLLSILQGICGMCFGLLMSAIAENTRTALIIIVGSLMPYLIISGIVWPLRAAVKSVSKTNRFFRAIGMSRTLSGFQMVKRDLIGTDGTRPTAPGNKGRGRGGGGGRLVVAGIVLGGLAFCANKYFCGHKKSR